MDAKLFSEVQEAERQIRKVVIFDDQTEQQIDCLQRAQDAIDRARAILSPAPRKVKSKKDDVVPPGETAMVL